VRESNVYSFRGRRSKTVPIHASTPAITAPIQERGGRTLMESPMERTGIEPVTPSLQSEGLRPGSQREKSMVEP
jgi:hypothetical protein